MSDDTGKYEKVVRMLRDSRPFLLHPKSLEEKVIGRIEDKMRRRGVPYFFENIFGWIYIGWIRRSFILLSGLLLIIFIYQQAGIISAVKTLENEVVSIKSGTKLNKIPDFERKLTVLKGTSGLVPERKIEVYESQLKEFIDSYNEMQLKYENLTNIIEQDSVLKKYIENRLREENRGKSNL
jgi:hypothetical protein